MGNDATGTIEDVGGEGNHRTLTYSSGMEEAVGYSIHTLEDLLKFTKVDLDVWYVDHWKANSWETTALIYDEVEKKKFPKVYTNIQIKASLSRKKAIPVSFEPIRPIQISPQPMNFSFSSKSTTDTTLVLGDAQMTYFREDGRLEPVHSREVLHLFIEAVAHLKPSKIVLLGDMFDLPDFSDKFLLSPEMTQTLQPALIEFAYWFFGVLPLRAGYMPKVYFLEGNHEQRLMRATVRNFQAAYGLRRVSEIDSFPLLSFPSLLGLHEHPEWEWVGGYPSNGVWISENTRVVHSDETNLDRIVKRLSYNVILGHNHRLDYRVHRLQTDKGEDTTYFLLSTGTAACPNRVPRSKHYVDWQQGFGVVRTVDEYSSALPVRVSNHMIEVDGTVIKAPKDIDDQVRSALMKTHGGYPW
jgi:hypothetical protein